MLGITIGTFLPIVMLLIFWCNGSKDNCLLKIILFIFLLNILLLMFAGIIYNSISLVYAIWMSWIYGISKMEKAIGFFNMLLRFFFTYGLINEFFMSETALTSIRA